MGSKFHTCTSAFRISVSCTKPKDPTMLVVKGQERLTEGTPLPVTNERDVFQYLGLEYLEPHERDW